MQASCRPIPFSLSLMANHCSECIFFRVLDMEDAAARPSATVLVGAGGSLAYRLPSASSYCTVGDAPVWSSHM